MNIPQKDIVEMNSHVFKISPGENIVKALSEGKILVNNPTTKAVGFLA